MAETVKRCVSCKNDVTNSPGSVTFKCPNCLKTDIVRCPKCRKDAAKYACSSCGFTGPN